LCKELIFRCSEVVVVLRECGSFEPEHRLREHRRRSKLCSYQLVYSVSITTTIVNSTGHFGRALYGDSPDSRLKVHIGSEGFVEKV
jgi:hypothetical protein